MGVGKKQVASGYRGDKAQRARPNDAVMSYFWGEGVEAASSLAWIADRPPEAYRSAGARGGLKA